MNLFENARAARSTEWGPDGLPKTRPVAEWPDLLRRLTSAAEWSKRSKNADLCERLREFARHCLGFTRPDGTFLFGDGSQSILDPLRAWAEIVEDEGIQTVLDRWTPPKRREPTIAPPPLPAFAGESRPTAILRADWSARGDWIAIDQRDPATPCLVELAGGGKRWIGPNWGEPTNARSQTVHWSTDSRADLFEWSFPSDAGKVVRTALLARERGWGILGEERRVSENAPICRVRLDLAPLVSATRPNESAALILSSGRRRASVASIGLDPTELRVENGGIALDRLSKGRRVWLPLLFTWNPDLLSKKLRVRILTVAEKSRVCAPDVAFAARIAWGVGESIVVYRSLARPSPRSFLGHQTSARFLVGLFHADGRVEPIVQVD